MTETTIPGTGEYADLALGPDGQVYLCAEVAQRDAVLVYRGARGQEVIAFLPGAFVGGQKLALYPRIAVNPFGQIAVTYQRGAALCVSLIGVRDDIRPEAEEPFGVEMIAVAWIASASFWRTAYVARIFRALRLVTRDYDRAGGEIGQSWTVTDTTQGVSRITSAGEVILIDADNIWPEFPNLSRPWQSGRLVTGQGNDAPARALGYTDGNTAKPYRIFDGYAYRPRSVEVSPGRWTVIATGTAGIRVVDVPPLTPDVAEPPEPPAPPRVTIADYQPREGVAPLTVNVTAARSGGPATRLTFSATGKAPFVIDVPEATEMVTWGFVETGVYELRARVEGPGGTDETGPRPVTVTAAEEPMPIPPYPDENTTQNDTLKRFEGEYVKAGKPLDWGAFKWQSRVMYDHCAGMAYKKSEDKHVRECQAELGNPVDPPDPS
jgi:hypothetical protein